jgi:sigma-B regulation protein RsbU (phosphoserine phosphatase)
MDNEVTWIFLLATTITFLSVFIQIVSERKPFQRMLNNKATWQDKIIIIALFGGFSIMGTYMGTELPSGAILNVRDIGPMIAGLVGGPVIGLASGLIGGIHRYFMGGLTQVPCALATILIGLICGLVHQRNGNKLISVPWGVLLAAVLEGFHMGLTLLIARPFAEALNVVKIVSLPMIVSNAIGILISLLLIKNNEPDNIVNNGVKTSQA